MVEVVLEEVFFDAFAGVGCLAISVAETYVVDRERLLFDDRSVSVRVQFYLTVLEVARYLCARDGGHRRGRRVR